MSGTLSRPTKPSNCAGHPPTSVPALRSHCPVAATNARMGRRPKFTEGIGRRPNDRCSHVCTHSIIQLESTMITILMRGTAWFLIILICALSLVPPSVRLVTEVAHDFEHLAIFLTTGVAFGLGYRRDHFVQAMALIGFAGAMEIAQSWSSGAPRAVERFSCRCNLCQYWHDGGFHHH